MQRCHCGACSVNRNTRSLSRNSKGSIDFLGNELVLPRAAPAAQRCRRCKSSPQPRSAPSPGQEAAVRGHHHILTGTERGNRAAPASLAPTPPGLVSPTAGAQRPVCCSSPARATAPRGIC